MLLNSHLDYCINLIFHGICNLVSGWLGTTTNQARKPFLSITPAVLKLLLAPFCQQDKINLFRLVFHTPTLIKCLNLPRSITSPLPWLTKSTVIKSLRFGVSPIQTPFLRSCLAWAVILGLCLMFLFWCIRLIVPTSQFDMSTGWVNT